MLIVELRVESLLIVGCLVYLQECGQIKIGEVAMSAIIARAVVNSIRSVETSARNASISQVKFLSSLGVPTFRVPFLRDFRFC